ncbi:ATP-binding protein [Chromobacterium violaceum]|uniref:ATP-binding protein n=1 Tax=Chromobacterium violaceum TaxID=536 RepID=UPI001E3EC596|nr:ATP-binding protein [Chromobacterium violaceum]MCD0490923.1 ATP-binding protein [Chromobacterium violaceum]
MSIKPSSVFTPRASSINSEMYVHRQDLEDSLSKKILNESKHIIVYGDSGCGKSWLYKKVLHDMQARSVIVNLANASRWKSIQAVFEHDVKSGKFVKTSYVETKKAGLGLAGVASGAVEHAATYTKFSDDPFIDVLNNLRREAGDRPAVIVLDNLENVFGEKSIMKELADLITLVDDEDYAVYGVKFIIVGTPYDVRNYFKETPETRTVANRLTALEEVYRLTDDQAKGIFQKGLCEKLGLLVEYDEKGQASLDFQKVIQHAVWITGCVPQRVHEYGLLLAEERVSDRFADWDVVMKRADSRWVKEYLEKAYSLIETSMNDRTTKIQRRNQVIYTVGHMNERDFKPSLVEDRLRNYFPKSTEGVVLNTSQILSEISVPHGEITRRTPKGDEYTLVDPAYRQCIRAMLKKFDEQVEKRSLTETIALF